MEAKIGGLAISTTPQARWTMVIPHGRSGSHGLRCKLWARSSRGVVDRAGASEEEVPVEADGEGLSVLLRSERGSPLTGAALGLPWERIAPRCCVAPGTLTPPAR